MSAFLYLFLLVLELLFLVGLSSYSIGLLYSSIMGAPYVPTSKKQIDTILERAKLKAGQRFIELGSGDGRIVRRAVQKYSVYGVGVDINVLLVLLSRIYAKKQHLSNISFRKDNIFSTSLSEADVVYLFLMPDTIKKILQKFEKELKPSTLLISHGFKIPGWEKKQIDVIKSEPFSTFFYRV